MRTWYGGGILLALVVAIWLGGTRLTTAQTIGTIRVAVDCKSDPERTIILNNTSQAISLDGWSLASLSRPIAGVEPFVLSGTLQPRASQIVLTGTGAPAGQTQLIYDDVDPSEGVRLRTPYGTLNVLCTAGSGELAISALATPPPSPTVTPTPTSTAGLAGSQLWLSSPPGVAGAASTCPQSGEWLLLYWSGPAVGIEQAVTACAAADVFWQRQTDRWLGYSQVTPAASDRWTVDPGAAVFIHGR
jgi:hypothetical protein